MPPSDATLFGLRPLWGSYHTDRERRPPQVVPLGFAIIMGFSQIYTVWEPMMFVWKGDSVLNIAPRFVELAVTITMLVTVFLILELVTNGSGPLQIPGYELQR